ncbi:unnamed protein product [Thelazia callipaeda]|uniref:Endo/exonuclease/phosphatase domain-containing protein n=1 Tax=Thelazia callipaeda TaxID=103827 RepID=A0A0N5D3I5_THECL|nr:unnamed protein product [Thelazia callipaeda]
MSGWTYRYTGKYFYPTVEDIGKFVSVVLDMGPSTCVAISEYVVVKIDEELIFEKRQAVYCQERAEGGNMRVVSYNVLADLYLNLKKRKDDGYFPYCPTKYLQILYYTFNFIGYKGDIIFLQEVDLSLSSFYLLRVMEDHGYDVYFKKKGLKVNEGLVICHRKEQFRYFYIVLCLDREYFSNPAFFQLLVLECNDPYQNHILLLANTHLYFNPKFTLIKVLQSLLCARWIVHIATSTKECNPESQLHVLFAGDFNSTPEEPVYELLSKGDPTSNIRYERNDLSFTIYPRSALFDLKLTNLADETQYTNYTSHKGGFDGCIDYIWGTPNLKVIIPMPSVDAAKKYVGLPSKICPSDHLPVVCDIQIQ